MKFVGVREAQAQLSGLVEQSQKERVVLTRHGEPIAVLTGVEGRDLEEYLLTQDAEFWRLIERRRRHRGPLVSHESVRARARRDAEREKAGARSQRQARTPRRSRARKP